MLVRLSLTSPFARKVRLAAAVLGLPLELGIADTMDPGDSMRTQNPLGKLPILINDEGEAFYDSRVICAYLDHLAGGGKLIPDEPAVRFAALKLEALADGLTDAGILILYESRFRPTERHEEKWLEHQRGKIARTFAALEAAPPALDGPLTIGAISLACALGFYDFRCEGTWRADHPKLVAWEAAFAAACPGYAETAPRL